MVLKEPLMRPPSVPTMFMVLLLCAFGSKEFCWLIPSGPIVLPLSVKVLLWELPFLRFLLYPFIRTPVCPIQAINRSTSPLMATASSQRISLLFFFLCGSLDLGSAKAMAKLVVLVAIALLAISIADSGSKVRAKATDGNKLLPLALSRSISLIQTRIPFHNLSFFPCCRC